MTMTAKPSISPMDAANLRMASRRVKLTAYRDGCVVEGTSADDVRAVTAAAIVSGAVGAAAVASVRPVQRGASFFAPLPRSFAKATPFLPWKKRARPLFPNAAAGNTVGALKPAEVTAPTLVSLLQALDKLRAAYGEDTFTTPQQIGDRWRTFVGANWSAKLSLPQAAGDGEGEGIFGILDDTVDVDPDSSFFDCPAGQHRSLEPGPSFGLCVDEEAVAQCFNPDTFFDAFLGACVCKDPSKMLDANGNCVAQPVPLPSCPAGEHLENGVCVKDKPPPGGGGTTVVPGDKPPPVKADTESTITEEDEDRLWLIGGGIALVLAIGTGLYLRRRKKRGRRR